MFTAFQFDYHNSVKYRPASNDWFIKFFFQNYSDTVWVGFSSGIKHDNAIRIEPSIFSLSCFAYSKDVNVQRLHLLFQVFQLTSQEKCCHIPCGDPDSVHFWGFYSSSLLTVWRFLLISTIYTGRASAGKLTTFTPFRVFRFGFSFMVVLGRGSEIVFLCFLQQQ